MTLFLSGGFDSAVIASGFRDAGLRPLCLTLATGHNDVDVARARRTAEHYGMEHHVVTVGPDSLLGQLDDFVTAMDQPSIDGFNTHLVAAASSAAGCPVGLSGAGADEILGGYRYYRAEGRLSELQRVATHVPSRVLGATSTVMARVMNRSRARIDGVLRSRSTVERHRAFRSLFTDVEVASLTGAVPPQANSWDVDPDAPAHVTLAALDATTYLQPTLLRDGDVQSMWHGVELRLPFVDTSVIDATRSTAASTPTLAAAPALTKAALAEAWGDDYLVEAAAEPKLTFRLPWAEWMGALTEATRDVLADVDPWHGLIDPERAKAVIAVESRGVAEPLRPWSLLVLAHWLSAPPAAPAVAAQLTGDEEVPA